MNKDYIEAQVVSLTRGIHPQDLGEETSKLENTLRQALEGVEQEMLVTLRDKIKGMKIEIHHTKECKFQKQKCNCGAIERNSYNKALNDILSSLPLLNNKEE